MLMIPRLHLNSSTDEYDPGQDATIYIPTSYHVHVGYS
jgi:hypothetical protein